MSEAAGTTERDRWGRLPAWLRPRERELEGRGRRRLIELTLLVLAGLLLTVAVVNDVFLQTHVNHRLNADLRTWRHDTGHDYVNISLEQDIYSHTTRDIACANTSPGPPGERVQLCLQLTGPIVHGLRAARGGWYLPPKTQDAPALRYGCFGEAKHPHGCGPPAQDVESLAGASPQASP
ncbi:MAG: hypothetical protein ACRDK7_03020 [Solirubrobacteraceae bacterium]